jgi:hypothetical protein
MSEPTIYDYAGGAPAFARLGHRLPRAISAGAASGQPDVRYGRRDCQPMIKGLLAWRVDR